MTDEQNDSMESKITTKSTLRKKKVYTGILWLLFSIALIALLFSSIVSMRIFLVICIGIWGLARYWGKKFDAVMFPQPFSGKIKKSKYYQLYFVTAMKQQWSAALLLFNVFPLVLMSVLIFNFNFINPILDLDEMKKYQGVVVRVHRAPANSSGSDYLWIETEKGVTIKLVNSLGPGDYDYLKNLTKQDKITVWAQMTWSLPPSLHREEVWQLQHGDHFTMKSIKIKSNV